MADDIPQDAAVPWHGPPVPGTQAGIPPTSRPGHEHWLRTAFPLCAARLAEAYGRTRETLAGDPLFIEDAAACGVTLEEVDRRMRQPPDRLDGEASASWDWLDGPDQCRWALMRILTEAYPPTERYGLTGRVVVPQGQIRVMDADVDIDGDLVLEEQAVLFVLGGLSVTGALAGAPGYSMVAARKIECADGATGGEVLALDGIRCPGTFYFGHNDHSARAASYEGGVLVDFERGNVFGRIDVQERVTDWDFPAAALVLGLPDDESDLLEAYTSKLLGEGGEA